SRPPYIVSTLATMPGRVVAVFHGGSNRARVISCRWGWKLFEGVIARAIAAAHVGTEFGDTAHLAHVDPVRIFRQPLAQHLYAARRCADRDTVQFVIDVQRTQQSALGKIGISRNAGLNFLQ